MRAIETRMNSPEAFLQPPETWSLRNRRKEGARMPVSRSPHTTHNTSPKYKAHKQRENTITQLQANKTHKTSIQDQLKPQINTSVAKIFYQILGIGESIY
jgi:hypothetical protein